MKLDELLKQNAAEIPDAGFTDSVMRRVSAEREGRKTVAAMPVRKRGFGAVVDLYSADIILALVGFVLAVGPIARIPVMLFQRLDVSFVGIAMLALGVVVFVAGDEVFA